MLKKYGYIIVCFAIFVVIGMATFFTQRDVADDQMQMQSFELYYFNASTNTLEREVRLFSVSVEELNSIDHATSRIEHILNELIVPSMNPNHAIILPSEVRMLYFTLIDDTDVSVTFSREYWDMQPYRELLVRSAIVLSLTSIESVESVSIFVEGQPIISSTGSYIGQISRADIRLNPQITRDEIETEQHFVNFYYVNNHINGLSVSERVVNIASDRTKEEQILEILLEGAHDNERNWGRLFIAPNARVLDVSTDDNTIYIDFSTEFDTAPEQGEVAQMLPIYAIVNTLTGINELGIDEVQFLIEAQIPTESEGYINLGQSFTRNERLVPMFGDD